MPFPRRDAKTERAAAPPNRDWWPNQLRVDLLNQHSTAPTRWVNFNYRKSLKSSITRSEALIRALLTDSQEWWPADWGSYIGLFIRMGGGAGTYRTVDGRAAQVVDSSALP